MRSSPPLLLLGLLLMCSAARADDDPRRKQAEPAFLEGLALHDAGREAEALGKFQKAYEIYPSPNALFQIARSEQLLGLPLDALRHYREALQSRLLHPKNLELGKGFVAELEGRLARVVIVGPAATKCRVAGADITLPLAEALDVEPGEIVASCTSGDGKQDGRATAVRGQLVRIELRSPTRSEALASEPPPLAPTRGFWTTRHTVGVALGGIAVVAAGVGGVFVGSREGHVADGKDVLAATAQPCAQPGAPSCAAYDDARSGVKSAETGAVVSFGAAAALGVTALVLILWPEQQREARMRVLPLGRDLSLTGTF
jgi:hypothetical protein